MTQMILHRTGPGVTVQDMGRPGHLAQGLSRGGAADRLALIEAAALLNLPAPVAALELPMMGADITVTAPMRMALTGARMVSDIDGAPLAANTSFTLVPGQRLRIGAAQAGTYGYLTPAGGIATPPIMDSRATHLTAGIGAPLPAGTELPLGPDRQPDLTPRVLRPDDRLSGGAIRVMPGPQTNLFSDPTCTRFWATPFRRSATGNRQGVRLDFDGAPFASDTSSLASDIIQPGDIQMTGEGVPYVLLTECQTMGGYPRIGTVLPCDLPRVAQAAPGAPLRFTPVTVSDADALWQSEHEQLKSIKKRVTPLRRDPHDIPDLLSYQLISGMIRGDEAEHS